ncbi:MAG: hypothetical protein II428_03310, partial [Muribaculaceae bacterium]|nr:hypothetical protein [Muribaculaceae bacterium]
NFHVQINRLHTILVIRSSDGYPILPDERVKRVWGIPKFSVRRTASRCLHRVIVIDRKLPPCLKVCLPVAGYTLERFLDAHGYVLEKSYLCKNDYSHRSQGWD